MTKSQSLKDDLCHKLRLVGLPREVVLPLVNSITVSVNAEGAESVVKRLKVLKQAAVNQIAGLPYELPWIKHDRNGPKGPWRKVWSLLKSKQYKHRKRALNAMMVYASLVLPKRAGPTPTQERKFLGSVSYPQNIVDTRKEAAISLTRSDDFDLALEKLFSVIGNERFNPHYQNFKEWIAVKRGTDSRRLLADEIQFVKFLESEPGISFQGFPEVQAVLGKETINRIVEYNKLLNSFSDVDEDDEDNQFHGFSKSWKKFQVPRKPIGVIGSTQEPGLKFRAFASPHMVLQCALDPLKEYLLEALKRCPWDCTHDQDSGVSIAQEWLRKGHTVHSVDLSDATNNFPLEIQLKVLESFHRIPDSTIQLLKGVSRSPFKVMWSGELVSWNVGQPLGAGPSFPAFALGHSIIALLAEVQAGYKWEDLGTSFLILGDDIVINNDCVHTCYRTILNTLGCPISESKCLSSDVAFEFAGKLATKDHIFHGFKYKEMSDVSFMPIIRTLGLQAISKELLTENQYRFARMTKNIPEPFGLGFNPKGQSLAERHELSLHLKEILDGRKPEQRRVSSSELVNRTLYTWGNHFRYLWQSNVKMYGYDQDIPEKEEIVQPLVTKQDEKGDQEMPAHIMEMIRAVPLRTATVASGDPRPNPLEGKVKKVEEVIAMAANRLNSGSLPVQTRRPSL